MWLCDRTGRSRGTSQPFLLRATQRCVRLNLTQPIHIHALAHSLIKPTFLPDNYVHKVNTLKQPHTHTQTRAHSIPPSHPLSHIPFSHTHLVLTAQRASALVNEDLQSILATVCSIPAYRLVLIADCGAAGHQLCNHLAGRHQRKLIQLIQLHFYSASNSDDAIPLTRCGVGKWNRRCCLFERITPL